MSSIFVKVWSNFLCFILKLIHFAYSGYEHFSLGWLLLKRKCKDLLHLSDFDSQIFVSEFVRNLKKCPSHFVVIVGNDGISYKDFSNLVLWCLAAKISFVSFYDYSGYLKANEYIYYKYLVDKKKVDPKCLNFDLEKLGAKNGVLHKIHLNITSLQDGKPLLLELTKELSQNVILKGLNPTEINETLISSKLLKYNGLPEPDLGVVSGKIFGTFGFLPWHIRVTEFLNMEFEELHSEDSIEEAENGTKREKFSSAERVARKVLAPFLRRIRRENTESFVPKSETEYHRRSIRSKIKEVISKLTSFCKDSLEVPTVLNETSEILKEVTKSAGASSYIVDETSEYLVLNPKYMPKKSRHTVKYKIEPETTVAAFVAYSQEFVMVNDILGDIRFPQGIPGCKKNVKSVLCVPVLTIVDGKCFAVIELFRTVDQEPYSALDLEICISMTGWMGAAIHQNNERLFLLKKTELNNYVTSLVEFFFAGALSFDKFVSDIVECAKLSVQAERGMFFVMEEEVKEGSEDEIVADVYEEGLSSSPCVFKKKNKQRYSKNSAGFVSYVARQGKVLNVQDAYNDPRFNRPVDAYGFLTRSVICIPLKGSQGVVGILQLVNKLEEPYFTHQDEILLQNISGFAYLVCEHAYLKEQLKKSYYRYTGSQDLLRIHIKPCPDDLRLLRSNPPYRKPDVPKAFFNFDWIVIGKEKNAPSYAVFMFVYLLGEQFFDYNTITDFVLTVKKSYRDNPYHNFAHAFTVCHCMFNVLHRNKETFTNLEIFALLIATICHDSDHFGYTNNFLEMTNHWLAELYWESPLEHHHYDVCMLMIEATGLFSRLNPTEWTETSRMIKKLILATDLVQLFRTRNSMTTLIKTKMFDWSNPDHRITFLGMVMTVCDLSGQCKPFYTAKRVTEGLYREFYNQGDIEKNLGLTPLTMMDREKTSSIPENQIQFLSLICIPSIEILVTVFPNTVELLKECVELRDCWSDIQAKKVVEVWKLGESYVEIKK